MYFATPKQMRVAEAYSDDHGVSYKQLMENAGKAAADIIRSRLDLEKGAVILCGKGNNGGDGFVIGRIFAAEGIKVTVAMLCGAAGTELAAEEFSTMGEGVTILSKNETAEIISAMKSCSVIIDAVYGTGFHGQLPVGVAELFRTAAAECSAPIVGIDVPSGGNCADGTVCGDTPECAFTVTFGYEKTGMLSYPLDKICGEIIVADIGFTDNCLRVCGYVPRRFEAEDFRRLFPKRQENAYKNKFGKLLVIAGCRKMSGAAAMAASAALRSGAGIVTLAAVDEVINRTASRIYEPTFLPLEADAAGAASEKNIPLLLSELKKYSAVLVGSGLSVTDGTKAVVKAVVENADCPIILDADGINCICSDIDIIRNTSGRLVFTPHQGELSRLYSAAFGMDMPDRLTAAAALSEELGVIICAKGVPSFVTGGGKARVCKAGNPGLSRGGSGDVLAGITAGFAAQGLDLLEAVTAAVYLHGQAADIAAQRLTEYAMLPTDVIDFMPAAFGEIMSF